MVLAASNPSAMSSEALSRYAEHLGLVFQMQDDYLDHYANNDLLGKGRASDLANKKTTFASLYSQDELLQLIKQQFLDAKKALHPLGDMANHLLILTDSLYQRCAL